MMRESHVISLFPITQGAVHGRILQVGPKQMAASNGCVRKDSEVVGRLQAELTHG